MIEEYIKEYSSVLTVLAAILISPAVPIVHIILMRAFRKNQKAVLFMFFSFAVYGALLLFVGFYAGRFALIPLFSLIGGFSTAVFLCLGYAEFFFMMVRGFSMRIVVDVYSYGKIALPQVIANYGGKGMNWMIDKRIKGIEALGMVEVNKEGLKLKSSAGAFAAKVGLLTKKILKLDKGG